MAQSCCNHLCPCTTFYRKEHAEMDMEQLAYFVKAAKLQHISKAAEELNISQSALSSNIKKLEYELGVPLFDRQGRHVLLNTYGESFLKNAEPILLALNHAKAELDSLQGTKDVRVRISMPPLYSFPNLQKRILDNCPAVAFELIRCPVADIPEQLLSGAIDFCVIGTLMESEHFHCETLSTDKMVLIAPASHPLAQVKEAPLARFSTDTFVNFSRPGGSTTRGITDLEIYCRKAGFEPHIVFSAPIMREIFEAVRGGVGISLAPERVLPVYNMDGLSVIQITEPQCYTHLRMYWLKGSRERPAVSLVRHCIEKFFLEEHE